MGAPGTRLAALARQLPAALMPKKNERGHWLKPALSARYAARLRRDAVVGGALGTYNQETGACVRARRVPFGAVV